MKYLIVDISGKVPNYDIALCEAMATNLLPKESLLLLAANIDVGNIDCNAKKLLSLVPKSLQNSENKIKRSVKALEGFANYLYLILYVFLKKPSVIHFQWLPFLEVSSIESCFLRLLKIVSPKSKLILTVHNIFPHNSNETEREKYRLRFTVVEKFFAFFILHLQSSKKEFCSEFWIKESRCRVIPHGVFEQKDLNISFHKPDAKFQLLMYGNQSYYKGTDILVDAIGCLPSDVQNKIHTSIVGKMSNEYLGKIQKKAEELDIEIIPEYIPNDELNKRIQESDLIVLPYREISQSGVLLLALFFEKPIICSNLSSFKETLDGFGDEMFFENGNARSLAYVITNFLNNRLNWSFYRDKIILLKEKYSWNSVSKKTLNLYNEG